jgi:hypothetical protein
MGQPMGQLMSQPIRRSMGQLLRQLIRPATIGPGRKLAALIKLYTNEAIHVRCDIEWIGSTLLNETEQWLLNNRTDGTVLSPF